MRILVVGDVHGNTEFMLTAIVRAAGRGISTILQVGDFGYWPHTASGEKFLKDLERAAADHGVTVWWIDGNHENHEWLGLKTRAEDGTVHVSEHCRYLPRGHRWEWNGVRFGALGGAFSIDWRMRVPMLSWWPQEVIYLRDVQPKSTSLLGDRRQRAGCFLIELQPSPRRLQPEPPCLATAVATRREVVLRCRFRALPQAQKRNFGLVVGGPCRGPHEL